MLEAVQVARRCIGEDLMQVLISKSVQSGEHDFDPTLVQLALSSVPRSLLQSDCGVLDFGGGRANLERHL